MSDSENARAAIGWQAAGTAKLQVLRVLIHLREQGASFEHIETALKVLKEMEGKE